MLLWLLSFYCFRCDLLHFRGKLVLIVLCGARIWGLSVFFLAALQRSRGDLIENQYMLFLFFERFRGIRSMSISVCYFF